MGRRRVDWIQLGILVVTILLALLHAERRIATVEQISRENSRQLEQIQHRLDDLTAKK